MNNSAAHTALKAECLLAYGARPGVRLFNNPVGEGWIGKPVRGMHADRLTLLAPRRVVFGLAPGSSDIIGFRSVTITVDMIGKTIAQIVAPEVKTGTGRLHGSQSPFLDTVTEAGGLAGIIRSPDDLGALLARPL